MPTEMPTPDPGRSFAERILGELQAVRQEMDALKMQVCILNECGSLLLRPMDEGDESPLAAMMRLAHLLVGGTEETHRRLEALHNTVLDPRLTTALRASIET